MHEALRRATRRNPRTMHNERRAAKLTNHNDYGDRGGEGVATFGV